MADRPPIPADPHEPLAGRAGPRDERRLLPSDAPPVASDGLHIRRGRSAYRNPWIDVWHYDIRRGGGPGGAEGSDGIYGVVHFRNRAVGVLAIDDQGRMPLVGQWRFTLQAPSWEIPEGGVPPEEPLAEGAARELAEETGWRAAHWAPLLAFDLSNSATDEVGALFLAWGTTPGVATPEKDEDLAVWVIPVARAVALVQAGVIRDALSVMALLAFDRLWATGTLPADLAQRLGPWQVWGEPEPVIRQRP